MTVVIAYLCLNLVIAVLVNSIELCELGAVFVGLNCWVKYIQNDLTM